MNSREYAKLASYCNANNCHIVDNRAVKNTTSPEDEKAIRIQELKQKLADSDYAIIKIAEGSAEVDEYSDLIEQRKAWRSEINDLEEDA